MYKALLICLLGVIGYQKGFAQKTSERDTLFYYVDKDDKITSEKEKAISVLIIKPRDTLANGNLYPVIQYYITGKLKLTGMSKNHSANLVLEGPCIKYFPTGIRQAIMNFENGDIIGNTTEYYPNGKIYNIKNYKKNSFEVLECRDTLGNILAEKGEGKWYSYNEIFTIKTEEGRIKNGSIQGAIDQVIDSAAYRRYDQTWDIVKSPDVKPMFSRGGEIFSQLV